MTLDDRNAELNKQLADNPIDGQIAALAKSDKSRRRQIKWLAVSLALDVLLTVGFGWTTLQAHTAANKAETNQNAILRSCETSNDSRAKNKQLWAYILSLPPGKPLTPEQQKQVNDFKVFVDNTFAPRNCQAEIQQK